MHVSHPQFFNSYVRRQSVWYVSVVQQNSKNSTVNSRKYLLKLINPWIDKKPHHLIMRICIGGGVVAELSEGEAVGFTLQQRSQLAVTGGSILAPVSNLKGHMERILF